jgi:hypothetical protein
MGWQDWKFAALGYAGLMREATKCDSDGIAWAS